jgi:hypothetical protein
MQRQVREYHREVDTMSTGNAEMNAAMRPVNAGAGFRCIGDSLNIRPDETLSIFGVQRGHTPNYLLRE